MRAKRFVMNSLAHIFLSVLSVIWVSPLVIVILTAFRGERGTFTSYIIPRTFTLSNFTNLFAVQSAGLNFPRWVMNTLVIAICACILATFFNLSTAYVMSRIRFRMRKKLIQIALVLGMFPGVMSMIAIYYILKGLGFLETGTLSQIALIMVYSGGAGLGFFVTKGFFDTIPLTIDEAAYIDGATKWEVFWKITVPLSKPVIVTTILGAFMGPWIDFIFARVILGQQVPYFTVAIGLFTMLQREFVQQYFTQFFAACVLISIPISILFLIIQRFYVEGVSGAVKG